MTDLWTKIKQERNKITTDFYEELLRRSDEKQRLQHLISGVSSVIVDESSMFLFVILLSDFKNDPFPLFNFVRYLF